MKIIWILYEYYMKIIWISYEDYMKTKWIFYEDCMNMIWILYENYMKIMWILKYEDNMGMLLIIWYHTSFGASSCWPIAKNVLETMGLMSCHHAQEWKLGNEHITGLARTWYQSDFTPYLGRKLKTTTWHLRFQSAIVSMGAPKLPPPFLGHSKISALSKLTNL